MFSLRDPAAGRFSFCWFFRICALLVAATLTAACSGGSLRNSLGNVFSGSEGQSVSSNLAPVAFSNIIGPPKAVGDQLTAQLVNEARQKKIPVVTDRSSPATYTVQGYLAQSNERTREKFSYILDVSDKSGKRVHRILGEEAVAAKPGAKPWSSINQAAMQKIAAKTVNDLATWLPTQTGSAATPPPAQRTPTARSTSTPPPAARSTPPPAATASRTTPAPPPARSASTRFAALVTPVSGAPGDGRTTLTKAVRSRLQARGVQVASTGGNDVYRVNGKVTMGPAPGGNQRVQIVWRVTGPSGKSLGTVTQKSDVAKGSLDKTWGAAAVAAGNAAASEIIKLIQKNRG